MLHPQAPQNTMPWHSAVPSRGGPAPALVRLAASLASLARYSSKLM
jgi:hypothetical protein